MPLPALLALISLCPGACRYDDTIAPKVVHPIAAATVLGGDSLCAKAGFKINSSTSVDVTYPNRSTCGAGLKVIRGSASTWSQANNRTLTINLAILNAGTTPIQLPVRLFLPSNGVSEIVPSGNPASKIVPLNPDSSPAGGGKVWLVGGTGILNVGDSTGVKGVQFQVQDPVTQAKFSFQATAQSADTARPPIPASALFPYDSTIVTSNPTDTGAVFFRNIFAVRFDDTTSGTTINSFFARHAATIIGGRTNARAYIVQVPDPGPTWSGYASFKALLNNESGVTYAAPVSWRNGATFFSRYPRDGASAGRQDWFLSPANAYTRSRLSIRAPLAWGCETGMYSSGLVKMAVLDYNFDAADSDFKASNINLQVPPPSVPRSPAIGYGTPGILEHGTMVAGIMVGRGNDGAGLAGMLWRADLTFFQYGDHNQIPSDYAGYLSDVVFPAAKTAHVKVLVSSATIGAADPDAVKAIRVALLDYLASGGLFIQATGNENTPLDVPSLLAVSNANYGLMKAAAYPFQGANEIGADTIYRNNVLFVAGTDTPTTPYSGSNFWIGATEIAAPAVNVMSITPGDGTDVQSGTSMAAPFVGGVAGMLAAMDPTLTAADLKHYILLGSQLRFDPTTGTYVTPPPVQGMPELIYQLDAYGSLSLLSRDRPNEPICSQDVHYDQSSQYMVIQRDANHADSFPFHAPNVDASVSVAQGGRLIAANQPRWNNQPGFGGVTVFNRVGTVLQQLSNIHQRQYLETDTADVYWVADPAPPFNGANKPVIDIRGPSRLNLGVSPMAPLVATVTADQVGASGVVVSPTGDYAGVTWNYTVFTTCTIQGNTGGSSVTTYDDNLVALSGGTGALLHSFVYDGCWRNQNPQPADDFEGGEDFAFSQDGNRILLTGLFGDPPTFNGQILSAIRSRVWEHDITANTGQVYPVQDHWVNAPRYSADGSSFHAYEQDYSFWQVGPTGIGGTCQDVYRSDAPATFGAQLSSASTSNRLLCELVQGNLVNPNAVPRPRGSLSRAAIASSHGAGRRARTGRQGSGPTH